MGLVWVAMSGGVDSAVAAALLLEQGHRVTGVTLQVRSTSDEAGGCCSVAAVRDARRVCDLLGIPHRTLNAEAVFEEHVVGPFASAYAAGMTPNPCVACNEQVKFGWLLARALEAGADALATGHYARILRDAGGRAWLARGVDAQKDQSYFLYRLSADQLAHAIFPVGELTKSAVRGMAERFGLPVARKAESQDACFEVLGRYEHVVAARQPDALRPGEIVDERGSVLGRHKGIARYTIGQRKGLGIGGGEPRYVVRLDAERNRVVVGPRKDLERTRVVAHRAVWREAADSPVRVEAVVRYRMEPVAAEAVLRGDELTARFDRAVEGVAPGQHLVCYRGEVVLGGGIIACAS